MAPHWQLNREPFRFAFLRTGVLSIVVGGVVARLSGGIARWPLATLMALWPSFGGHWVEVWFINWLRPRLPIAHRVQAATRVGIWFVGGVGLALGMMLTATALAGFRYRHWPAWLLLGGLAFIGIELAVHLVLQLLGRPNFFNGRG